MKIQMILRQVRKPGNIKLHAQHPTQHQRMRRHLHHHMRHPFRQHLHKQCLQRGRLRRGERRRHRATINLRAGRTDQSHPIAGRQQPGLQHVTRGSLPRRAGNPNHRELRRRVPIDGRGRNPQHRPHIINHQHRTGLPRRRQQPPPGLIRENRRRRSIRGKPRPMHPRARHRRKQRPRRQLGGIQPHLSNRHLSLFRRTALHPRTYKLRHIQNRNSHNRKSSSFNLYKNLIYAFF